MRERYSLISTVYSGILILLNARWDNGSGQVQGVGDVCREMCSPGSAGVLIDRYIFYLRGILS